MDCSGVEMMERAWADLRKEETADVFIVGGESCRIAQICMRGHAHAVHMHFDGAQRTQGPCRVSPTTPTEMHEPECLGPETALY